jgi:hypothetical protein
MMGISVIRRKIRSNMICTNMIFTKTKAARSICLAVALAGAACAQVGAPVLGYLPVGGRILPVSGISASASIAPALDFGGEFLQMAISPRQDFALVSAAASGAILLAYPNGTTTPVAGTAAYPSSIALSPSGSAAVLWFASARLLEIVSGLRSTPTVRTVDASFLGTSSDLPAALAVSDDGAWGVGAWSGQESSSGVWVFGPNGEVRNLLPGDRAFALAFLAGQESLLAATRAGVFSVTGLDGSAAASLIYTSQDGHAPVGLAVSADHLTAILAEQGGSIVAFGVAFGLNATGSLTTAAPARVDCACAPQGVFPMGGSVFRITSLTGSVFRVFDARAGSVFQVPLSPGAAAGEIPSGSIRSNIQPGEGRAGEGSPSESGLTLEGSR